MKLVGRHEEIHTLEQITKSGKPEFLAIYGRRRIGKTYLIRQFFLAKRDCIYFNITGAKDGTRAEQLAHFTTEISRVFYDGMPLVSPKTWDNAFFMLNKVIEQRPKNKKIILFLDELPWMATPKSRLLQTLDYYWNHYWSADQRIKLIICGSSASWIIKNVINNKGGLHNRVTHKMRLEPFTLSQTKDFLEYNGITLKPPHILLLYMVTGGVPYYLAHLKKGLSVAQLIEPIAFTEKGILFDEFNNLFSSLFDKADNYIALVKTIANKQYGIGKRELLKTIGKSVLGSVGIKMLDELEEAGFIMSFTPYQHKRQGVYYRLIDEYTFFYLKWIAPLKNSLQKKGLDKGNWQAIQRTPEWYNWLGYAFETVCYRHISLIRKSLSLTPDSVASAWRYAPRKGANERGAQIDLLFDRPDDSITLCEIKYSEEPFKITKDYAYVLQRKMTVFKEQTRTKKHLFLAMITSMGLKESIYSEDMVDGVVTLVDLFKTG